MARELNLLTDALPDSLTICGAAYPIVTDFRRWIIVVELFGDAADPLTKAEYAAKLIFGIETAKLMPISDNSSFFESLVSEIMRFISCGKTHEGVSQNKSAERNPAFDFSCDAELIYASFLQTYGIDLCDPSLKLHFWKFMALLRTLPPDSEFMRVVSLRMTDTAKIENDELRRRIRRAKSAVRIR